MTPYDVVAKAREYIGTPNIKNGRCKRIGIDCLGLWLSVAEDLGLKDNFGKPITRKDYPSYSLQPTDTFLQKEAARRLVLPAPGKIEVGNFVVLRNPDISCHCGIIGIRDGALSLIHVYDGSGINKCVEHDFHPKWSRRVTAVFALPGVA